MIVNNKITKLGTILKIQSVKHERELFNWDCNSRKLNGIKCTYLICGNNTTEELLVLGRFIEKLTLT